MKCKVGPTGGPHRLERVNDPTSFSDQLQIIFNQQFSTSISYHDLHRTWKDLKLVLSIKRKFKKLPIIIRESDKSGIIHIGYKSDYDKKVLLY
jgi:hypothetical protein